jgi:hypothetical protein
MSDLDVSTRSRVNTPRTRVMSARTVSRAAPVGITRRIGGGSTLGRALSASGTDTRFAWQSGHCVTWACAR